MQACAARFHALAEAAKSRTGGSLSALAPVGSGSSNDDEASLADGSVGSMGACSQCEDSDEGDEDESDEQGLTLEPELKDMDEASVRRLAAMDGDGLWWRPCHDPWWDQWEHWPGDDGSAAEGGLADDASVVVVTGGGGYEQRDSLGLGKHAQRMYCDYHDLLAVKWKTHHTPRMQLLAAKAWNMRRSGQWRGCDAASRGSMSGARCTGAASSPLTTVL